MHRNDGHQKHFTWFALRQATCSVQESIVDVDFLKRGGDTMSQLEPHQRLYKIKHIRMMLVTNITGDKRVIDCLARPKSMRAEDYLYYS
jgi:hypothetical protein